MKTVLSNRERVVLCKLTSLISYVMAFCLAFSSLTQTVDAQVPQQAWRVNVEPHWFADGKRFWYKIDLPQGTPEFWVVDVTVGERTAAFDHQQILSFINHQLKLDTSGPGWLAESIKMLDNEIVEIDFANGGRFQWNKSNDQVEMSREPAPVLPVKLFLPTTPSTQSTAVTQLELSNELDEAMEILWVDPRGALTEYGTIAAGAKFQIQTYAGHVWLIRKGPDQQLGCFVAQGNSMSFALTQELVDGVERRENRPNRRRRNAGGRTFRMPGGRAVSPDRQWAVLVQEANLWLEANEKPSAENQANDESKFQLTTNATPENSFQRDATRARLVSMQFGLEDFSSDTPNAIWSPDSKYVLAFQTQRVPERRVHFVESSPGDQLHPKLSSYPYAKPGDALPVSLPRLFRVEDKSEIPLSADLYPNPFDLRFERWSEDGTKGYFVYNQRGHQVIRVLELTLSDGKIRPVIEETSSTFIHYSDPGKSVLRWLPNQQALWASERSGWNHLYRFDVATGTVLNPVTSGAWNVRRLERMDDDQQLIWFFAVGVIPGQDPYHEHFCRVKWDGTDFRVLTEGDGTHQIIWSPDRSVFIDTYSRVDLPPVNELRSSLDGHLICELEKGFVTGFVEKVASGVSGRRMPERFVATGRDGQTDIWGIVHWPRNFDPQLKYPVIENIYAGPHDHHVPKSFSIGYGTQQRIADAGFIVVQIDGMGTAWRSKAFHDVCYRNLRDAGFPDRIAWIKALSEKFPCVDDHRVGIYGGSAGGQNAMAALLWFNDFYSVACADCGCHDNRMDKIWWNEQWMGELGDQTHYVESSNMENAHLLQGHLLLTVGEADQNVDPATTYQVVGRLIQAGKDFTFIPMIGGGHGSGESPYGSRKRLEFFLEHLGTPNPLPTPDH